MIDLVIPLGTGSIDNDFEIKYCIRSFEKHFKDLGKVFIVGAKPFFFNWTNPKLIHIDFQDRLIHNKDGNLILKVLEVCKREDLSKDFIRASDDQILLKSVDINDFYPRYLLDLKDKEIISGNNWKKRVRNTKEQLLKEKYTTYFYESHFPMLYQKDSFQMVMGKYPIEEKGGFTINTLYFNQVLDKHIQLGDIKLTLQNPIFSFEEFSKLRENKLFLGYNNKGIRNGVLRQWIQNEFKEKSSFEI